MKKLVALLFVCGVAVIVVGTLFIANSQSTGFTSVFSAIWSK